jgi:hypothetical protein
MASGLVTYCHKCTRPSNLGTRRPKPLYRAVEPWLLLLLLLLLLLNLGYVFVNNVKFNFKNVVNT